MTSELRKLLKLSRVFHFVIFWTFVWTRSNLYQNKEDIMPNENQRKCKYKHKQIYMYQNIENVLLNLIQTCPVHIF